MIKFARLDFKIPRKSVIIKSRDSMSFKGYRILNYLKIRHTTSEWLSINKMILF